MSDSVRPCGWQPKRLPCPWDSPGKNTGVGCHFILQFRKVKSESEVTQSCPTLSDPMDCGPPGSSVHGIFQARVLEWGAIVFSKEPEIKLPTSVGSSKKQDSSRKTSISALLTWPKPLTVWITINCGKFWKIWEYQITWPASWETCMQVKMQQLELDVEQ